jgi:hypothetical protein
LWQDGGGMSQLNGTTTLPEWQMNVEVVCKRPPLAGCHVDSLQSSEILMHLE